MALTFEEARRSVEQRARNLRPRETEWVRLREACGRVLARDVVADRDLPPFRRATRDGFALRAEDAAQRLRVVGEVRAGAESTRTVGAGETVSIMTGAPVPEGADAVVMIEHTARDGEYVELQRGISSGENFVERGAEARAGSVLLTVGTRLSAAAVAVAASVGASELEVYRQPTVAVLATGDEIVQVEHIPGAAQIRNSNSYSLAAQIEAAGAKAVLLPVARDSHDSLRAGIAAGLAHDLLIVSGGVSAGSYDFVEAVLAEFGAEFSFESVLIQPGKPTVFGVAQAKPFFGLPGNPVSTMVTFQLFVAPVLAALGGATPEPLRFLRLPLAADFRTKTGLTRFLPARVTGEFAEAKVEPVAWQGSGDVVSAAQADCYLVVPPDVELMRAGEMVLVLPKLA